MDKADFDIHIAIDLDLVAWLIDGEAGLTKAGQTITDIDTVMGNALLRTARQARQEDKIAQATAWAEAAGEQGTPSRFVFGAGSPDDGSPPTDPPGPDEGAS